MLAATLGIGPVASERLCRGAYRLNPHRKEAELALLFVRLFQALIAIVADANTARQWLASHNLALNGRPGELIRGVEGLVRVVHYLEDCRCQSG